MFARRVSLILYLKIYKNKAGSRFLSSPSRATDDKGEDMVRQSNRPTATNYQDYLLDYSGVDLSRYRGQVEESPEAAVARAYNERHPDGPSGRKR